MRRVRPRIVGLGCGALVLLCVGGSVGAWLAVRSFATVEPADVTHPRAWDDGRLRFDYPGNWEVERIALASQQVAMVQLQASGFVPVVLYTYMPASVLAPDPELDALLFHSNPGGELVEVGARTSMRRRMLGVEAQGRASSAQWQFGPESLMMSASCFTANDPGADRSAAVCIRVFDSVASALDPGAELILDTLEWSR